MSKLITFEDLRYANVQRNKEWDPAAALSGAFRGLELAGEIGELCNVVKKMERERLGLPGSRASWSRFTEELGDAQICLDLLAMHYSADLAEATKLAFNTKSLAMALQTRIL